MGSAEMGAVSAEMDTSEGSGAGAAAADAVAASASSSRTGSGSCIGSGFVDSSGTSAAATGTTSGMTLTGLSAGVGVLSSGMEPGWSASTSPLTAALLADVWDCEGVDANVLGASLGIGGSSSGFGLTSPRRSRPWPHPSRPRRPVALGDSPTPPSAPGVEVPGCGGSSEAAEAETAKRAAISDEAVLVEPGVLAEAASTGERFDDDPVAPPRGGAMAGAPNTENVLGALGAGTLVPSGGGGALSILGEVLLKAGECKADCDGGAAGGARRLVALPVIPGMSPDPAVPARAMGVGARVGAMTAALWARACSQSSGTSNNESSSRFASAGDAARGCAGSGCWSEDVAICVDGTELEWIHVEPLWHSCGAGGCGCRVGGGGGARLGEMGSGRLVPTTGSCGGGRPGSSSGLLCATLPSRRM
eukprot:scaffold234595_cov30-Tisochrysis_lutea.AAC.4